MSNIIETSSKGFALYVCDAIKDSVDRQSDPKNRIVVSMQRVLDKLTLITNCDGWAEEEIVIDCPSEVWLSGLEGCTEKHALSYVKEHLAMHSLLIKNVEFVAGRYQTTVMVELNSGEIDDAFAFYPDELYFSENEFIGLTIDEAEERFHKQDIAYLRS